MKTPAERLKSSLTKDNLWIYILALLKEGEMYAYEINDKIESRFGFRPGNVTAYLVLNKLRTGGYVEVSRRGQSGGPVRRYFRITEKGKKELEAIREPVMMFNRIIAGSRKPVHA